MAEVRLLDGEFIKRIHKSSGPFLLLCTRLQYISQFAINLPRYVTQESATVCNPTLPWFATNKHAPVCNSTLPSFMTQKCRPPLWVYIHSLYKKWSFLLRISSVNVTNQAVFYGFAHMYWRTPQWKASFLCSDFFSFDKYTFVVLYLFLSMIFDAPPFKEQFQFLQSAASCISF